MIVRCMILCSLVFFLAGCEDSKNRVSANSRFAGIDEKSIISEYSDGVYTKISLQNSLTLAGEIPIVVIPSDETQANWEELRVLAAAIIDALANDSFATLDNIGAKGNNGIPLSEQLRKNRERSPNFNWESLDLPNSKIQVYGLGDESSLQGIPEYRAIDFPKISAGNYTHYIRLEFRVGHILNGKNLVAFGFFQEGFEGSPNLHGIIHTNLTTVQE